MWGHDVDYREHSAEESEGEPGTDSADDGSDQEPVKGGSPRALPAPVGPEAPGAMGSDTGAESWSSGPRGGAGGSVPERAGDTSDGAGSVDLGASPGFFDSDQGGAGWGTGDVSASSQTVGSFRSRALCSNSQPRPAQGKGKGQGKRVRGRGDDPARRLSHPRRPNPARAAAPPHCPSPVCGGSPPLRPGEVREPDDNPGCLVEEAPAALEFIPLLDDCDWGPVSPQDQFCFACARGETGASEIDNQWHQRLQKVMSQAGHNMALFDHCRIVKTFYEKNFQAWEAEKQPWTLRSIRAHLTSHVSTSSAAYFQRMLATLGSHLCDSGVLTRDPVTQKKVVHAGNSILLMKVIAQHQQIERSRASKPAK